MVPSDGTEDTLTDYLTDEDLAFVKRLVLSSGSFKAVAAACGVSCPPLRPLLDHLIDRIKVHDDARITHRAGVGDSTRIPSQENSAVRSSGAGPKPPTRSN